MAQSITIGDWQWNSDKTGFWLAERNIYYNHICNSCKMDFSYPVKKDVCPVCNGAIKCREVSLGKIEAASSKEWSSTMNKVPVVNEHMVAAAQQDIREHPMQEAGFDWQHLKDNV